MKIAIVTNKKVENTKSVLSKLENELVKNALDYEIIDIDSLKSGYDFICVIGGDGTILKTARYYAEFDTPILGINLGRLGFLSQSGTSEIEKVVEHIKNKSYKVQDRIMLKSGDFVALNDFVIKGCSCTRTSKFSLRINDKFVCDYIADGIIISTPTGSTAYGLSAGGPILCPDIDCLVVVPICPHTLNARPLVVPSNEVITVKTSDKLLSVAIDGFETEECVEKITIKAAERKAKLAFLKQGRFYEVLRDKLHWGISEAI